jgi:penicillin-binding protein 1A
MVILDAQNGQVKALRGGYGKKEASNTLNRASSSLMQRQPGSSIKPIAVYAPAIDLHLITPATVVDDVPVYMNEKTPDKEYPRNYDGKHDGLTSVRNGLKASVNVVTAKIWKDFLGANNSIDYLKKVGIDRPDEKYLSLVMGGLNKGVNPLQMAAAYVPFAHEGMYYEPTTFTLVKDSEGNTLIDKKPKYDAAYSKQTAFIMEDMMKEVTKGQDSTYPHGGTAASYVTEKTIGMPVAGKTGTTSDNTDKWFVGYTPYYVAATWYGYDNDNNVKITLNSAEQSQALKIWAAVMGEVHKGLEKKDFPVPSGIVTKTICIYSGKVATPLCAQDPRGNATRVEYFIKGTEPRDDDLCTLHVQANVDKTSQFNLFGFKVNLLAGPYCPPQDVISKVFIQRPVPYVPVKPGESPPKDIQYELPAGEYCNVHGGPPAGQTGATGNNESTGTTGSTTDTGSPIDSSGTSSDGGQNTDGQSGFDGLE